MQIKREIATMKLIKHPNVVRLFEVIVDWKRGHVKIRASSIIWHCIMYTSIFQCFIFLYVFKINLQVMGSKTKIYIVLEFVTGGELFDKIVSLFLFHLFMLISHRMHQCPFSYYANKSLRSTMVQLVLVALYWYFFYHVLLINRSIMVGWGKMKQGDTSNSL